MYVGYVYTGSISGYFTNFISQRWNIRIAVSDSFRFFQEMTVQKSPHNCIDLLSPAGYRGETLTPRQYF